MLAIGLLAVLLGGCSSAATPEFDVATGRYAATFDAAREVLRDHRFQLERVDAQAGVITTQPKATAGLASPWDREQSSLKQEYEDLINNQRRVVRVLFEGEADGPRRGRVEVTVYRMQSPGLRPASRAVAMTTVSVDPQASARGVGWAYEVPVSQDSRFAARLAAEIAAAAAKVK